MTLRNTSGKFSLAHFGRKASGAGHDGPSSADRTNGHYSDDPGSPVRENGGGGGGGGLDGLGKKLGKSIAHQSLLPGLGNKEQRVLQDLISAEKGVMQMAERFGQETQKAAGALQPYGAQEGPDLQDILTQSSTLLNQLGTALAVFVDHSANLRGCYKRIREREEVLDDLRRKRRATGAKAETAEKKLAKMGPENKQLPSQTELLESLRSQMRQMDTDIINEESKIGDFKRQQVKEALSYKFGGLEELGEKMCIIGELGKLLLEEVPLEETPPGYGRAPYLGYDKTENAVNEATKCLATVKFSAGSANPKPPGLPPHNPSERLHTPQLPNPHDISAAEEYGNYPGGPDAASPQAKGKSRDYSLDANPYGGVTSVYGHPGQDHQYSDFGGSRNPNDRHVMFQGPESPQAAERPKPSTHDYEYEQQQQLDAEERAWRGSHGLPSGPDVTAVSGAPQLGPPAAVHSGSQDENGVSPWQPLNVKRGEGAPASVTLHDGGAPTLDTPDLGEHIAANSGNSYIASPTDMDLAPPPPIGGPRPGTVTPGERESGFYTPMETPEPTFPETLPVPPPPPAPPAPAPIPVPSPALPPTAAQSYTTATGSGKISAAAFRRGAKKSTDTEEGAYGSSAGRSGQSPEGAGREPRRLPLPPAGGSSLAGNFARPQTPIEAGFELPASPTVDGQATKPANGAFDNAAGHDGPPPSYGHSESLR